MHPALQKLIDKLERDRHALLASVVALDESAFKQSPAPGKWSASQILMHLVVAERLSLMYMKKKSMGIELAGDSGLLESAKLLLLKVSQRLPLRFKAPQVVLDQTPMTLSLAEVTHEWDRVRNDLFDFLQRFDERTLRRKIYKHQVVGRLDVRQALAFFNEHVHHHAPQIRRIVHR